MAFYSSNDASQQPQYTGNIKQEAQLLLRDHATFVSFEYVGMLSADRVYPS